MYPAPPVTRMFTPTPLLFFASRLLGAPNPCAGPIGDEFADAAFVEDTARWLEHELGVRGDEFLGCGRGVVPRPSRFPPGTSCRSSMMPSVAMT